MPTIKAKYEFSILQDVKGLLLKMQAQLSWLNSGHGTRASTVQVKVVLDMQVMYTQQFSVP